jgi:hypothetical protein
MGHVERLARWIIGTAVNRLPASERERFREEWLAHLEETSGSLARIWHSVGCYLGAAELAEIPLQYTEIDAVLTAAIQGRHLVSIWYDPGVRVVEPYALGQGSDGRLLLRAFQVAGASESGQPVHWKLFCLDQIQAAKPDGPLFKPRSEYRLNDSAMAGGISLQLQTPRPGLTAFLKRFLESLTRPSA